MRGITLGCLILLASATEVGAQFRPPVYPPPTPAPTYRPPVYRPPTYQQPTYQPPANQPSKPYVLLPAGPQRRNDPIDDGEPLGGMGGAAVADPIPQSNGPQANGNEQPWTPPPAAPIEVPRFPENRAAPVANNNRELIPVAIGVVVLFVFLCIMVGIATAGLPPGRVRIVGLPPGEVPEEIRRAWIGLELPTTSETAEVVPILGTETGKEFGALSCFTVDGATALAALAEKNPEAAAWWTTNSPHTRDPGFKLLFPADVCEVVAIAP